tara:strand:- start:165 stop:410 length:246 start_codon:yes stop_codon:yes gene_type:complete
MRCIFVTALYALRKALFISPSRIIISESPWDKSTSVITSSAQKPLVITFAVTVGFMFLVDPEWIRVEIPSTFDVWTSLNKS